MRTLGPRIVDALALLALAAYAAALLRKTLLAGGAMMGYDLFNYFFPAKTFAAAALARGELPLWNPYIFFGAPFLANIQMAVLYPPDLLFVILSFPRAVAVSQWAHLFLGAAGMYALCRHGWGLRPLASFIGALVFEGSGFFAAHMGHLNQVHAGVWLPWVALCALRLAVLGLPRGLPWLTGGGAAVGLLLTAGHTQEAYYALFAVGLLVLGFTLFPPARAPRRLWHLVGFGAIALNGALLASAQLLPAVELSRLSYRQGGIPLDEAVAFGVERTNILETVLPTFWSLPSQEVTGYVGIAALVLGIAALGASPARRTVFALAALAALALTLTLGTYTPLYPLLYRFVPLFNSFRAPGRWVLVSCFALAGLAAHGLDALAWQPSLLARERRALRFGVALSAAAAVLALFVWRTDAVHAIQWLPHARVGVLWFLAGFGAMALGLCSIYARLPWPGLALAAVIGLELAFAAHEAEYNQPGDPALYAQQPGIAQYLRSATEALPAAAGPARVLSLAVEERLDPERFGRAVPDGDGEYKRYASMREALKPDLGMVYGLPSIDGYDGGLLPTRDYARFKALLITREAPVPHLTLPAQPTAANSSLLASLGIPYLLTDGRYGSPGEGWVEQPSAPGAAWLYANSQPVSRLLLPARTLAEPDADAALRLLATSDVSQLAILDATGEAALGAATGSATVPVSSTSSPGTSTTGSHAAIVRYTNQVVEIATTVDRPSLLVLTDSFYPGWRAAVDGRSVPIARVDLLFRGVAVPAGSHTVRFWFEPLSVKLGGAVSLAAIVANLAAFILWQRARRGFALPSAARRTPPASR